MKVRDIIKMLEEGRVYEENPWKSSPIQHGSKTGRVTLPGHPNDDLPAGTLNSVLKQAGLQP